MDLRQNIKKTLKEQTQENHSKDRIVKLIKKLLEGIKHREDDVCDIEVISPENRRALDPNVRFQYIRINIVFSKERNRDYQESVANEIWDIINNYTGEHVDLYFVTNKKCKKI
jgi:hypothetical protein